jgi:tRNA G18 (ribose-2'-O)-methylase SpoU
VGAVVEPDATPLARFHAPARFALLLGAEGPGLSAAARACCDHRVTIPMSAGADSLNVATAGAIFLYGLLMAGGRR